MGQLELNLKTKNMKRVIFFTFVIFAVFVSCSKEVGNNSIPGEPDNLGLTAGDIESVLATAGDFEFAGSETKTVISQSGSNPPSFAWAEGDVIGIVPNDGKTLQANYEIAEIGDDPKSARFDGGSWALKRDKQYAAYYPYREKLVRSADTLQFSFLGQRIAANNSLAHLGAYDYMYSSATFPEGGNAALNFKHLISLVRFRITVNHSETYTKLVLTSPDNSGWFATKASLKLETGSLTALQSQKSLDIPLDNIALTKGDVLTVWIAMLPTDVLSGKSLGFTLTGTDGSYSGEFANLKSFEAGKAYSFSFELSQTIDLSEGGSANCYIVDKDGKYKFKAVKGNTNESVGEVKGVKVLWETFGTDTAPNVGDLVKADVSYADGYITFNTNDTYHKGNAVIAAYSDAGCTKGNVLWSWHIWLTDLPVECNYGSGRVMMDRNLGATSAAPGEAEFLGLLYQWGRKDPFPGSYELHSSEYYAPLAKSTINWPSPVGTNETTGNVDYLTKHPTTFITSSKNPWDWSSTSDGTLWQYQKTQYDPCPPGWRTPEPSIWPFDELRGPAYFDENTKSYSVLIENREWPYPASGYRDSAFGGMSEVGSAGRYWTCQVDYCIFFDYDSSLSEWARSYYTNKRGPHADGYPVRCQKAN